MPTIELGASTFGDVVVKPGITIVDFWAEWCGPCKQLGPVLEQVIADTDGRVELAKVDVDANPAVAAKYGIRGIPTIGLFQAGELTGQVVGARPRHMIEAELGLTRFATKA